MDSQKRVAARLKNDRAALTEAAARAILAVAASGGSERVVPCPACGSLMHYAISKPLGKVFARCERDGCLSVSEPFLTST